MGVFDYKLPENLDVSVGDLVEVPLKKSTCIAIVRSTSGRASSSNLRSVIRIVRKAYICEEDILRLEKIARAIIQSPSSILYTALYGMREETIEPQWLQAAKPETESWSDKIWDDLRKRIGDSNQLSLQLSFSQSCTLASWLRSNVNDQLLVLAPWEVQTQAIAARSFLGDRALALHGRTPPRERAAIIEAWRTGECKTLISTRQGSLLPANNLSAVLVAGATSDDHMNWDRNPRFDARLAAELLAKQHKCPLVFTGDLPRVEDIARKRTILTASRSKFQIINLRADEERIGLPLISESLKAGITAALQKQKSVLCSFNRKGFARRLQCKDCEHVPTCGTCGAVPVVRKSDIVCPVCENEMWRPKSCPACGSQKLKLRGIGNERLAGVLRKTFPGAVVEIIDKEHPEIKQADIYLVTEFYFHAQYSATYRPPFGLVAELAADLELGAGNERAFEHLAQKMYRLGHIARAHKVPCIIQTWLPELIKSICEPKKFLEHEWQQRKTYELPPSREQYVIDVRGERPTTPELEIINRLKDLPGTSVNKSSYRWDVRFKTDILPYIHERISELPDRYRIQPTLSTYETTGSHKPE